MSRITLSRNAASAAVTYSEEAKNALLTNVNIMDNTVNSQFEGLQDPTFKKYLELSGQMQDMLKQVGMKMDSISEYCQDVIRWIDEYTDI